MKKNNQIVLLVGSSGAGKTSVAEYLTKEYGLKPIASYTTRPMRTPNERGHIFVDEEVFAELRPDMCAYTYINGYHYGATNSQVNNSDLYVIDEDGIAYFKDKYTGDKIIKIVRLYASEEICINRMRSRGDKEEEIQYRIKFDQERAKRFKEIVKGFPKENVLEVNIGERSVKDIAEHVYKFI